MINLTNSARVAGGTGSGPFSGSGGGWGGEGIYITGSHNSLGVAGTAQILGGAAGQGGSNGTAGSGVFGGVGGDGISIGDYSTGIPVCVNGQGYSACDLTQSVGINSTNNSVALSGSAMVRGGTGGAGGSGTALAIGGDGGYGLYIVANSSAITVGGTAAIWGGNGGTGGTSATPSVITGGRTNAGGGDGGAGIGIGSYDTSANQSENSYGWITAPVGVTVNLAAGTSVTGGNGGAGGVGGKGGDAGAAILVAGGTNVSITNAGTLQGGTGGAAGAGSSAGATGAAVDMTHATGSVTFNNSGTLIGNVLLSAYSDQISFSGGSLTGDIVAQNAGPASIGFASGVTTLTGNIGGGNAVGAVTVSSGATLAFGSSATISASGVANNGTLNLGSYAITVSAPVTGAGGIVTTIGAATHGYLINSASATNISAMTITPAVTGGVAKGAEYILVQGYGGSAGVPTVTPSGGVTWTASVVTSTGTTELDAGGVSFGPAGTKDIVILAAASATGAALVQSAGSPQNGAALSPVANYSGSNAALSSLASAVTSLTSTADIQKAGAQLRPEVNGGTTQAALGATTQALGTIQVRSDAVRSASADQTGISSGEALRGFGGWGQGFGSTASQDRRQDVDGYNADTYGLAFGLDARVADPVRVGLSFAYARTNVDDSGSRDGSGEKISSYIGSLYGTYSAKRWYVDGALTYGRHEYDSTRLVNFAGATAQTAKASFSGQQYGAKAEAGIPLAVASVAITPLVSLAYNHLAQDGYTEAGAAGADLSVGNSATDSIRSGLGAKASTTIAQLGDWNIRPNVRAVWLHEFNAAAPDQTSTFVAGGAGFTTPGIKVAQEHADFGLGLDLASTRNTTVSAKYDADLSDRYLSHTGSMQVRMEF